MSTTAIGQTLIIVGILLIIVGVVAMFVFAFRQNLRGVHITSSVAGASLLTVLAGLFVYAS